MDPSLGLLLERLLWPVPRVRWEAARAVARLIRAGDDRALDALLEWTARRTLESECLLGLGVIHAFDLAEFCPEDTARRAVSKPSLTSDWMLRTIYGTHQRSAPFRYAVSPPTPAHLKEDVAALFDRFKTTAVPPVFLHTLEQLEGTLDFAFVDRWRHDWSWICRTDGAKVPELGFVLRPPGQGRSGPLHLPQGEMLVSAYLRTLAYALHMGKIRADQAQDHAMLALPMNRGLAELEPVERPTWSRKLLQRWRDSGQELVEEVWAQAGRHTRPGETPAALHVVEVEEKGFIEVEVDVVLGHGTLGAGESLAETPKFGWEDTEPGSMGGDIQLCEASLGPLLEPMTFACLVAPEHIGRVDASVALQVKLACLALGWRRGRVRCRRNEIELQVGTEVVSRWSHWYAEWGPSRFTQLDTMVSSMTTIQRTWLLEYVRSSDFAVALVARVRVGTREHRHQDHSVDVQEFWINPREAVSRS